MSAAFVRGSWILSFDSAEVGGESDHEAISPSCPHPLLCARSRSTGCGSSIETLQRVSGSEEIEWAGICHRRRHSRLRNPATADFFA
jgi:hypothetical protein